VPAYLTKARVLEAFCAFRDFITEDHPQPGVVELAIGAGLRAMAKPG